MSRKRRMPRWLRSALSEDQFKLWIAWLCAISGIPLIFVAVPPPGSLALMLNPVGVRLWGFSVGLSGVLIITGILLRHIKARRRYIEGLMVEAAGLIPLCLSTIILGTMALYVVGKPAIFGACVYLSFAGAAASRFWAIQQIVKTIRVALDQEEGKKREPE
jgi:hypothetical protein